MKVVLTSIVNLFVLLGLNSCYTILPISEECNKVTEVMVYNPVPVPTPPPRPVYPPVSPIIHPPYVPSPPINDPEPKPIIRLPEVSKDRRGYEEQVRDPLRRQGERGNSERIPDPVNKANRNDGGRK